MDFETSQYGKINGYDDHRQSPTHYQGYGNWTQNCTKIYFKTSPKARQKS